MPKMMMAISTKKPTMKTHSAMKMKIMMSACLKCFSVIVVIFLGFGQQHVVMRLIELCGKANQRR